MRLRDFAAVNAQLNLEDFRRQYPTCALLVSSQKDGDPMFGAGLFTTPATGDISRAMAAEADNYLVVPLAKRDPNASDFMITLGRASRSDIQLDDTTISKMHAYFRLNPRTMSWSLADAGSSNGTEVDGVRLTANQLADLKPGAQILLANSTRCIFHTPDSLHHHIQAIAFVGL